jgi:cell division protease FtsH
MNSTLGPVAFDRANSQFLNDGNQRRQISDEVAQQIDRQIKAAIDRGYETARQILTSNRSLLTQISELLLEKEVLEGDELQALLLQAI